MPFLAPAIPALVSAGVGFAADELLGGSGGEGSPAQITDTTPREFQALRQPVSQGIQDILDGGGFLDSDIFRNIDTFSTNIGGAEKEALAKLNIRAGNLSPDDEAARKFFRDQVGGAGFDNPFLDDAITAATDPLLKAFERVTLPSLKQGFSRLGQTVRPDEPTGRASSPFTFSTALAQNDLLDQVRNVSSKLSFDNFEQARLIQQESAKQLSGLQVQDVNLLVQNLTAQALPRLIEEVGLDRAINEFNNFMDNIIASLGIGGQLGSGQNIQTPAVASTPSPLEGGLRTLTNDLFGGAGTGLSSALDNFVNPGPSGINLTQQFG